MNTHITIEDLFIDAKRPADRRRFAPTQPGASEDKAQVRRWINCTIPALTFTWIPEYFIYTETEHQAFQLSDLGYSVTRGQSGWFTYACGTRLESRTFMNFRRYAWQWTEDPSGAHGYARGPVYANGHRWWGLALTPGEVVRLTAVEAITTLYRELPEHFNTAEIQQLLAELVEDGVVHARPQHARPESVSQAYLSKVQVIIDETTEEAMSA